MSCGSDAGYGHHNAYAQEKAHSDGEDDHYGHDSHSDYHSCARLTYESVVVPTEKSVDAYTEESYTTQEFYTEYTDYEYNIEENGKEENEMNIEVDCYKFVDNEYTGKRQVPELEEYEATLISYEYETTEEEVDVCKTVKDCHTDWECASQFEEEIFVKEI